jgi:ketosteroid isomerase-like protein
MNTFTIKRIAISDVYHETVGDLSFAWGLYSLTLAPKAGGEMIRVDGRFSDVSRKIDGKWLYIVDHASAVPAAPLPPSKQ